MTENVYIHLDGAPAVPSFRIARGEVKTHWDWDFEAPNILVRVLHPYDIVQKLGEAGNFTQAFAALNGFIRKQIDIQADSANKRIDEMYRE
jgi:hypothetical protein